MEIMFDIFLILLSPFIGVLVGLLPAMGAFFTLILLYPVVSGMSPLALIIFYAILINARDFSGSVSALNFGLMGETTSLPVLQERKLIVENNGQKIALKNTMLDSIIGMLMGIIILHVCFYLVESCFFLNLKYFFLSLFFLNKKNPSFSILFHVFSHNYKTHLIKCL